MEITEAKTYLVDAQNGGQAGRPRGRNRPFVEVLTDEGLAGVGEGSGGAVVVEEAIRGPRCSSIGEGPSDVERPWPRSYDVLHGHGVRGAVRGGAIGAIDRDIEGEALGSPSASRWEEGRGVGSGSKGTPAPLGPRSAS